MAFRCLKCGARASWIEQSEVGDEGVEYTLTIDSMDDLKRQVVKSKWAPVQFPELQLEIPAETQPGSFNTVEGLLVHTIDALKMVRGPSWWTWSSSTQWLTLGEPGRARHTEPATARGFVPGACGATKRVLGETVDGTPGASCGSALLGAHH